MSTAATAARSRPALAALGRAADWLTRHVAIALGAIVLVQLAATVALFFSINHNGWLTYQGGDQIWLMTNGWLLGQGTLPWAVTGYGWPLLVAPLTWIAGPSSVQLLPLTTALQAVVLGPIATLAVYDIGARLAGRLGGLWCAAAFVAAPFLAIPFFVDSYHDRWVDQILPQALGLTQQADFPSVVAVLVAAALTVRALEAGAYREAILAGTFAGAALALKPANVVFLAGPALAFLLARRWREAVLFAVALAPALLTLAVWKSRGLGEVPLFADGAVTLAAGLGDPVVGASWFERTVSIDLDTWKQNMSNLREFSWSARLVQWLPLAGAVAVARRSVPAAGLLLVWLLAYVLVKGSSNVATIESGSFWRLVLPALPAFAILTAAIPLLIPGLPRALGSRLAPAPARRPGRLATLAVLAVASLLPFVVVLTATQFRSSPGWEEAAAIVVDENLVPADPSIVQLRVRRTARGNELTWTDTTKRASTFYEVYRASPSTTRGVHCELNGVDQCRLEAESLGRTRATRFLDPSPPPDATYRIGVAANWLDEIDRGDVVAISPPAAPSSG